LNVKPDTTPYVSRISTACGIKVLSGKKRYFIIVKEEN
jgi:hypothetical protein